MTGTPRIVQRTTAWIVIACAAVACLALSSRALAAFPGANGQIAVVHYDPALPSGGRGIYTIDPATLGLNQLTGTEASDDEPSYSADGERIAFTRREPSDPERVWMMNADGSGQVQVAEPPAPETTNDSSPAFSPDGTKLVFIRDRVGEAPQIWTMNVDGSAQTQLTFGGDETWFEVPSFSPDGRKIVTEYQVGSSGYRIAVLDADGSNFQPLTTGPQNDGEPEWSPDGRRITFERNDEIWIMNADGTGQAPLTDVAATDFALQPAFAPDASRVLWVYNDASGNFSDLRLADPDGFNQVTPLTQNSETDVSDYDPSWQPLNPPACELAGKAAQKSVKSIRLRVTCANENATVVAKGSGKAPKVGRLAASKKKNKFKLPAVTMQVPAGRATTLKLAVPKRASKSLKRAMKAGKKGKAKITATLTDDLGDASRETFKVAFKKKK